ncbi:pentapeptide repeat-containing protein [Sphingopyxis sp. HXXIV]|nr:hypothetical protein [Sphingopyxis sp. HXXIV]KTE29504.1 hypothetical protein ATE62_20955 [Sphingopyxis sp. HIX]
MTDLADMLARLERMEQQGASILDLMTAACLDPRKDFRGGKWTYVKFDGLNLDEFNFRETRLFGATFRNTSVKNSQFQGAEGAIPTNGKPRGLFLARNWREADLDDYQRLALLQCAYRQAPDREPLPVAAFVRSGLITASNYLEFMRRSHDYEVAREIYENMQKNGVAANKYAITELIQLAERQDILIDLLYAEAVNQGVEIDSILLNTMADSYSNNSLAQEVIIKFSRHGLHADEFYYNIMIKKAVDRPSAESYLNQMREAGIDPSNVTINSLMMKSPNWSARKDFIEQMKTMKLPVRVEDVNNLLSAATSKMEIRESLDLFRKLSIPMDIATHNIRIHKRKSFHDALAVVKEAIAEGQKPDVFTQTALMRRAESIAEVCEAMALLRPFPGIDIFNDKTIARLMRLSPDWQWSATRVQGMEMSGASPRERAKALIVHWIDENVREETVRAIFGLQ